MGMMRMSQKIRIILVLCWVCCITGTALGAMTDIGSQENGDAGNSINAQSPQEEEFYRIVFDTEEKIQEAHENLKTVSSGKNWEAISEAEKEISDQLSFQAYQISRLNVQEAYKPMTTAYRQSLLSLSELFSTAYQHNLGNGDYKTINSRLKEIEGRSNEYYATFLAELSVIDSDLYNEFIRTFNPKTLKMG